MELNWVGSQWIEGWVISGYIQFGNIRFYVVVYGYEFISVSRMGDWNIS